MIRFSHLAALGLLSTATAATAQIAPKPDKPIDPNVSIKPGQAIPVSVDTVVSVTGQGSVRWVGGFCAPKSTEASAVCKRPMTLGRSVTVNAEPRPGQVFKGWAGVCSGQARSCTFTPSKNAALTANFAPLGQGLPKRTVTIIMPNNAVVEAAALEASPFGGVSGKPIPLTLECKTIGAPIGGATAKSCAVSTALPVVQLRGKYVAAPLSTNAQASDWNGACMSKSENMCVVFMDKDKSVQLNSK